MCSTKRRQRNDKEKNIQEKGTKNVKVCWASFNKNGDDEIVVKFD